MRSSAAALACVALASAAPACVAARVAPAPRAHLQADSAVLPASAGKIDHVVILVQENRSFDNLFQGYPGANTQSFGINSKGQTIPLQPIGLETRYEVDHFVNDFLSACDGSPAGQNCKNDGFDQEFAYGKQLPSNPQYAYVSQAETKPYFELAAGYVLADAMFTSQIDASFPSHQYIIAGQAGTPPTCR